MNYTKELNKLMQPVHYKGYTIFPAPNRKWRFLFGLYDTVDDAKEAADRFTINLRSLKVHK